VQVGSVTVEMDDEHERRVRLLLLRKGAVLPYCSTVRSLLGWTKSSGPASRLVDDRGAIAMREMH
jgi:hypothetical protein